MDSLFNIQLEGTITAGTKSICNRNGTVEYISKTKFKKLISLGPKTESLFKQIVGVAMGSSFWPTIANAFLWFYKKIWLETFPD